MPEEIYRTCPCCGKALLPVSELKTRANCPNCGAWIEAQFSYKILFNVLLAGGSSWFFRHGWPIPGAVLLTMLIFYCVFFDWVNARYLPLKHYEH